MLPKIKKETDVRKFDEVVDQIEKAAFVLEEVLIREEILKDGEYPIMSFEEIKSGSPMEVQCSSLETILKIDVYSMLAAYESLKVNIPNLVFLDFVCIALCNEYSHFIQQKFEYSFINGNISIIESTADILSGKLFSIVKGKNANLEDIESIAHAVFLLGQKNDVYLPERSRVRKEYLKHKVNRRASSGYNTQKMRRELFLQGFNSLQSLQGLIAELKF